MGELESAPSEPILIKKKCGSLSYAIQIIHHIYGSSSRQERLRSKVCCAGYVAPGDFEASKYFR
jgi:hypothetical protein